MSEKNQSFPSVENVTYGENTATTNFCEKNYDDIWYFFLRQTL